MKSIIPILLILIVSLVKGQSINYLDLRDSSIYKTININGTIWMLDNMRYETDLSRQPTLAEKEKHNLSNTEGRYYHFLELDSICPNGWRLPKWEDWESYMNYLLKDYDRLQLTIETAKDPHHHVIEGFYGVMDIFAEGNSLNLRPVGRFQGESISTSPDTPFADYWTLDENEDIPGTSHAHLWEVLNIHSHEHHMDPTKEDEIRRFMCRCVKDK
jgi:uncharacterized protein (TIGR02145 family)